MPNAPGPERVAVERLAPPRRIDRRTWLYACAAIVGSTVWLWPHILQFRSVPDRGDPIFSAWRLARFAHQLTKDPWHLFDGNIFHPLPLTLTYSDPTALQGLLAFPFIAAGIDPLVVANLLLFAAFPACALAFFFAAWRLTGEPQSALIAGLLGAWYPFHGEHYSHLELQWFMFVPLALTALMLVLDRPTVIRGALLGAAVGAQWLASMYIGLMLLSAVVPFAVILAIRWRVRPSMRLVRAASVAAAIAIPALSFTAVPYWASLDQRGERGIEEVTAGSATISDYLATHRRMASYNRRSRVHNQPERELCPGVSPVVLASLGVSSGFGAVKLASVVAGAFAFDWSLGFTGLTYGALYSTLAPYRGIRVPARFAVIVGSLLILLGAFGTEVLLRRVRAGRVRLVACGTLAVIVLLDLRLTTPLVGYWPTIPQIYGRVTPEMVLAEFPTSHAVHHMYFSTRHWARLIGGYSGFIPRDPELHELLEAFPSRDAIDGLRRRGATHLTYNCAFERSPERCRSNLEVLHSNTSLEQLATERWSGSEVRLYRLR